MAEQVAEIFTEVIVAPGYEPGAMEILAAGSSIRILVAAAPAARSGGEADFRWSAGADHRPGRCTRRRPAELDAGLR
jgi:phosphoribosylaminoimidazolecarboxamide formyltransferase/IMP cyclohydrolase